VTKKHWRHLLHTESTYTVACHRHDKISWKKTLQTLHLNPTGGICCTLSLRTALAAMIIKTDYGKTHYKHIIKKTLVALAAH